MSRGETYIGKKCGNCGTTEKYKKQHHCVKCANERSARVNQKRRGANVQPKVLWGTKLRQLIEDNKSMTSQELAAKYELSIATISRYQNCIRNGNIRFNNETAPKKFTPEELSALHTGKIEYRPWC